MIERLSNSSSVDEAWRSVAVTKRSDFAEKQPEIADNKLLAVVAATLASIAATGMTSFNRMAAREGGLVAPDFNLIRCIFSLTISTVWCLMAGKNPLRDYPAH